MKIKLLQKEVYSLWKVLCSYRSKFFPEELSFIEKVGKNEKGRVASPDIIYLRLGIPCHLLYIISKIISLLTSC